MNCNHQRGMALLTATFVLAALLCMCALAVDAGIAYTARTSAQHAADAAALAGAFTFVTNPTATDPVALAQQHATAAAAQNFILGNRVVVPDGNVTVDTANRRVTVTVPLTGVKTYFAQFAGYPGLNVTAQATAEASETPAGTSCMKPFYAGNAWNGVNKPQDCAAAYAANEVFFDASGNVNTSALGADITLWNQKLAAPSQWGLVDLTNNKGGAALRDLMTNCLNDVTGTPVIQCGDLLPTTTGGKIGPVGQGVEDLIGYASGKGSPVADTWQDIGQYCDQGDCSPEHIKTTSPSLVTIAIWDCQSPVWPGSNSQVVVAGFAQVFLDPVTDQKKLTAHVVNVSSCNGYTGSTETGPFAVPVRLVQTPRT